MNPPGGHPENRGQRAAKCPRKEWMRRFLKKLYPRHLRTAGLKWRITGGGTWQLAQVEPNGYKGIQRICRSELAQRIDTRGSAATDRYAALWGSPNPTDAPSRRPVAVGVLVVVVLAVCVWIGRDEVNHGQHEPQGGPGGRGSRSGRCRSRRSRHLVRSRTWSPSGFVNAG